MHAPDHRSPVCSCACPPCALAPDHPPAGPHGWTERELAARGATLGSERDPVTPALAVELAGLPTVARELDPVLARLRGDAARRMLEEGSATFGPIPELELRALDGDR